MLTLYVRTRKEKQTCGWLQTHMLRRTQTNVQQRFVHSSHVTDTERDGGVELVKMISQDVKYLNPQ